MKSSSNILVGAVLISLTVLPVLVFYNNVSAELLLEKVSIGENEIRIQNSLEQPIVDLELIENTEECLVDCHAIIKIHPYQDITLPDSSNEEFKWEFIKADQDMLGLRDYSFEILSKVSYQVDVPIYGKENYEYYNNETGKNETFQRETVTEYNQETLYKNEYQAFDYWGETLKANNDYYIKLIGNKYPMLGENNIDWIPTMLGLRINEWGWWNSTWQYRKSIDVEVSDGSTLTDYQILLNVTNESNMQSDFDDLRFTNNCSDGTAGAYELDYCIGSDCGDNYYDKVDSNYADVWVKVSTINSTICMYYGNEDENLTSESNPINTFIFFDDFDADTSASYYVYSGGWDDWGTGHVNSTADNSFLYLNNITTNNYTIFEVYSMSNHYIKPLRRDPDRDYDNNYHYHIGDDNSVSLKERVSASNTELNSTSRSFTKKKFYFTGFAEELAGQLFVYNDLILNLTYIDTTPRGSGYYCIILGDPDDQLDWLRVRKFNYPEPTHEFGNETEYYINATEEDALVAIQDGIDQSEIGENAPTYQYQQIYVRYSNGSHLLGTFDVVALSGNKTWAFNYVNSSETESGMGNLTNVLYISEFWNMTESAITTHVNTFINETN